MYATTREGSSTITHYKVLGLIYLLSVASGPIANLLHLNVQALYRVPLANIRWIDIALLFVIGTYCKNLFRQRPLVKGNAFLVTLIFLYLIFEAFQLARSWGRTEANYQISWFFCTLNFFILIDLCTFRISKDDLLAFLKYFAIAGAITLMVVNLITFASFVAGRVIVTDENYRIGLSVAGEGESIYTSVLLAYVYAFGLYFLQHGSKPLEKAIFITAILSIFLSMIYSFSRGDLFTLFAITVVYVTLFSKKLQQAVVQTINIAALLLIFYFLFADTFREKGYDPAEKITETAKFAFDFDNPDWDKGRSVSRSYALKSWKDNFWVGVGYDPLYHHGAPADLATAHNFFITSLFHRGLAGTIIYTLILLILFKNAVKVWFRAKRLERDEGDLLKLLVIVSFAWLVPFWNQEVIWEKYSLSIQFMYLGFLTSMYRQELSSR